MDVEMGSSQAQHEVLVRIGEAAVAIDTRPFESALGTVSQLVEALLLVASNATDTLEHISEPLGNNGSGALCEVAQSAQSSSVCDIAFVANWDLRQRTERVAFLNSAQDPWLVITECASLRRHIIKSMVQVEQVLCKETGMTTRLAKLHKSDLETALASRRAYLNFIGRTRAVEARIASDDSDVEHALRLSAANIATLIGRAVYQDLRVTDRRQLRSLQTRILTAAKAPVKDQLGARRLWMDISAYAQLLTQVHERLELVQHDFDFLTELLAHINDAETLSQAQFDCLRQLEGRDADLDRHLANNEHSAPALYDNLVALHARLAATLGRPPVAALTTTSKITNIF